MSREVHVRFWESAKARFPRATQLSISILDAHRLVVGRTVPFSRDDPTSAPIYLLHESSL